MIQAVQVGEIVKLLVCVQCQRVLAVTCAAACRKLGYELEGPYMVKYLAPAAVQLAGMHAGKHAGQAAAAAAAVAGVAAVAAASSPAAAGAAAGSACSTVYRRRWTRPVAAAAMPVAVI
jgi:hypothetical protein